MRDAARDSSHGAFRFSLGRGRATVRSLIKNYLPRAPEIVFMIEFLRSCVRGGSAKLTQLSVGSFIYEPVADNPITADPLDVQMNY